MSETIQPVTDETFDAEVLGADGTVLVDFWAAWCGPCKKVAPILEEIATENADRIRIVKVDTEANPGLVARFGITSIPTLNVYSGGELVQQIVGARPKQRLVADLADHLG